MIRKNNLPDKGINCLPAKLLRKKKYPYNKFCIESETNKDKRKSNIRNEEGNEKIIKKCENDVKNS